MRVRKFTLNSEDQVVVKVVREILNLFKIETGCEADFDWEELNIVNTIRPDVLPIVETVIDMTGTDGRKIHLVQEAEGRADERYAAGMHRLIKLNLYQLFRREFGFSPAPWGILHGVRPTKIVHRLLDSGLSRDEVAERLCHDYEASNEKAATITDMAIRQKPFLARSDNKTISIYVGIPFCLSRCLYCSFPANILPDQAGLDQFMAVFNKDLMAVKQAVRDYGFKVQSIYVGGGTPTSLPDKYFRDMLTNVWSAFYGADTVEFTVEAGRPDSMSEDKIRTMVDMNVTRVSVNPQTMQQRTLKRIGRNHTPEAIIEMFYNLRQAGIPEINMDLIIGLPGEGVADVRDTMEKIIALGPDDITLHSLALKRGSVLKLNLADYELPEDDTCREMFKTAMDYIYKAGLKPYYLYRQGYMSGQLENVGCCRAGAESMYNIQIMEERQTILGIGGAATSKVVNFHTNRLKSSFNAKDLITYLRDIDIYIDKRAKLIAEAYGDTQ
ncbi:coproporphyrinogen dehydrogenase HemZ [Anaerovibrio sp.]|uniref:coproporphyrinogen dehydrogenase HemZ n=1 Tax=Anaerovibrio sp. TaxID=1872532 RepID=UPI0025BA1554|nr:coproporphyrinogen dehydrogenase HemZ [Anaerovibrio sp.]MBR2143744.1 coproporphyrinogen dehydrogenase HemZ [Anaerovibrio sp.]